jgi:murein L,D-transpeptidase YafK
MEEIYGLVEEAFKGGQEKVQLQAFPFRMTAQNLASHAGDPNMQFWEMLKAGSDTFLATNQPPRVAVCERRYVFNPVIFGDLDPSAACPVGTRVAATQRPVHSAATIATSTNTEIVAYHINDSTPQKINESLRGIY